MQIKEAEIVQLKEINLRREERDVDETPDYASSEDERGSRQERQTKLRPLSSSLHLSDSPTQELGTRREIVSEDKVSRQRFVLHQHRRVKNVSLTCNLTYRLSEGIEKPQTQPAPSDSTPKARHPNAQNAGKEQESSDWRNSTTVADHVAHQDVTRLEAEVLQSQVNITSLKRCFPPQCLAFRLLPLLILRPSFSWALSN